jgi:aspartokinase
MVVVLSAMAGQTDSLIKLARQVCDDPDPRNWMIMATGEQVTVALFAIAVKSMGTMLDLSQISGGYPYGHAVRKSKNPRD